MWKIAGQVLTPVIGGAQYLLAPLKKGPRPVVLPRGFKPVPPTPVDEVDKAVEDLFIAKDHWITVGVAERAQILRECMDLTAALSDELAQASVDAKGSYGNGLGEELATVLSVIIMLRKYREAMLANGQPKPERLHQRPDGQWVADVFPSAIEHLLFAGYRGEVWIEPGKAPTQGALYRKKTAGEAVEGAVSVVLGAGNQLAVVFSDILDQLFVHDRVVLVKMSPVNEYIGPLLLRALAPLVTRRVLALAYGGAEVGSACVKHPRVTHVHLTGSAATFNAIVWGDPKGKRSGEPLLAKAVTAELGNVTPLIIVPGDWTEEDMANVADDIVTAVVHNAGHNCVAAEVLVTPRDWWMRDLFLRVLRNRLAAAYKRVPYYPGSAAKYDAFCQKFPEAAAVGLDPEPAPGPEEAAKVKPWVLASGLGPNDAVTDVENWCGVLQEVCLPGSDDDLSAYLTHAVDFANHRCEGQLTASLYVSDSTQRKHGALVDDAVSRLRYGAVGVNTSGAFMYGVAQASWGAFPGNTVYNIGSGVGTVHNTYLFDAPQKSVMYVPWRPAPTPFWRYNNYNSEAVCRAAQHLFLQDSVLQQLLAVNAVAVQALLG